MYGCTLPGYTLPAMPPSVYRVLYSPCCGPSEALPPWEGLTGLAPTSSWLVLFVSYMDSSRLSARLVQLTIQYINQG